MLKLCLERKISLCAVVFLLLIGFSSHAQLNPALGSSQWKYVNPFQYGFVMNDISFVDNNNGLAVGNNGALAKSTDGGYNWQYLPFKYITPTNQVSLATLNDVHFVTPTIAYAVGSGGLMIKTTDGGLNWTQIATPLTPLARNINGLHFINKDTGYIGGAALLTTNTTDINCAPKVYVTRNGGATWDSLATPFVRQFTNATLNWNNQKEIQRIHFVNDSVGYVTGSSGNDFTGGQSALLWKIKNNTVTDYCLHRTKFGLTTGSHQPSVQQYKGLLAISDSMVLISSLNNNFVLRVKTGENDSTASALPAIYGNYVEGNYEIVVSLTALPPFFPASLVAAGVAGQMQHLKKAPNGNIILTVGSKIAYSPDNGTTWGATQRISPYSWWGLSAMDVAPNGRIVTGGSSGIMYDSLPGSPWRTQWRSFKPLNASGVPNDFSSMDWADCNNGVVVGSNGTIGKTSDGGMTWVDNTSPVFEAAQIGFGKVIYPAVNSMYFSSFNTLYKSADQGTTIDGIFADPHANGQIKSFAVVGQKAWVAGYRSGPTTAARRSLIFRTQNATAALPVWDTVGVFPTGTFVPQFNNIKFANQDTGYVCANRGKVYRTIDGGSTWTDVSPDTTINSNGTNNYSGLSVVNGRTIYVGGSSKKLFKSTDAGATWTDLTLVLTTPSTISNFSSLSIIEMNDANNGYIMAGTFLLKTTDGWATWTYDMSPLGISSMMLYPKIAGPIANKKLMFTTLQASTFVNSQISATILEYGNPALVNVTSSETVTNASCSSPSGGSITVNATGGILPYTYSINGGTPQSSNVFTGLTTGPKTVVIRDAGCQVVTKAITVPFTDNLTLTANNDTTVCANAPVQMLATANLAGTTFAWSPATGLTNVNIANPVATTAINRTYTVSATLNGCVRTEPVVITIKPNPIISAGPDKTIVVGDQVKLEGSANNAVTIAWTPNSTLTNANTFTPTATPTTTTTYTLTVVNTDNCTSTDQATVNVIPYCIKVMAAFTPNGDGINERWLVTDGNACTNQIKVAVYNRYGNVVYSNDDYTNNWDGTYKGKPVADGTYYYNITYKTITGKTVFAKGDVTILR